MSRFLTPIIAFSFLCLFISFAYAEEGKLYVAGFLGFNLSQDHDYTNLNAFSGTGELSFDASPSFGGALGLKLDNNIRLEAEIGYSKNEISGIKTPSGNSNTPTGDVKAITFMLSGYYDFDLDWRLKPFIGAGAGLGYFDVDINDNGANLTQDSAGDDLNLIYQLSGGLRYEVSDSTNISGAYRYLGSTDIGFDQTDIDYDSHEIRVGLDYALPILWEE